MACKRSAVRSRLAPPIFVLKRDWKTSFPGHSVHLRYAFCGAIAQLGERLHGMQEVSGSIPLSSTTKLPIPDLFKAFSPSFLVLPRLGLLVFLLSSFLGSRIRACFNFTQVTV